MPSLSGARGFALASSVFLCAANPLAPRAQQAGAGLVLKPNQEIVFALSVANGKIGLGPGRLERPGAGAPKDGEIAVGIVKHGLSPYADLTATEKTSAPVDFVATGLIGDIKIDEIVVCGRLDAPATAHIASGVWRVSLNRFAVHAAEASATRREGGLPCPR